MKIFKHRKNMHDALIKDVDDWKAGIMVSLEMALQKLNAIEMRKIRVEIPHRADEMHFNGELPAKEWIETYDMLEKCRRLYTMEVSRCDGSIMLLVKRIWEASLPDVHATQISQERHSSVTAWLDSTRMSLVDPFINSVNSAEKGLEGAETAGEAMRILEELLTGNNGINKTMSGLVMRLNQARAGDFNVPVEKALLSSGRPSMYELRYTGPMGEWMELCFKVLRHPLDEIIEEREAAGETGAIRMPLRPGKQQGLTHTEDSGNA